MFLLLLPAIVFSQEKKVTYIISPLMTYPIVVEKNKSFNCEIDFSLISPASDISLSFSLSEMENEEVLYPLKSKKISYDENIRLGRYKLSLPKKIKEGLYNLHLKIKSKENVYQDIQYKSVKVVYRYPDNFSFVIAPDIHIAKTSTLFGAQNYEKVIFAFEEISKKNPEFVLIPGDIMNGINYKREYKDAWEFFKALKIPIYVVPGNHDGLIVVARERGEMVEQDGREYWKDNFGKSFFSFSFGKFYFIGIDTFGWDREKRKSPLLSVGAISPEHLLWIEEELKKVKKEKKEIIIFGHHPVHSDNNAEPDMSEEGKEKFLELCKKYKVKVVISGHTHWDSLDILNETYFIGVTTPCASPYQNGYYGFREIEVKDNQIVRINYKDPQFEEYNKLVGPWQQTPYTERIWSTPLYFPE